MTTGAYRGRLGDPRVTTALLTQGRDNAARRAAAWWTLGSKAKYALAANRGQVALTGKAVALYYGHPSFWGYHIRFRGLGDPRMTNSLFMLASTSAVRKAAKQWTFGKLRALTVGANVGTFTFNGQTIVPEEGHRLVAGAAAFVVGGQQVTLTYTQGAQPAAPATGAVGQASMQTPQRGRQIRSSVFPPVPLAHYFMKLEPGAFAFTGQPVTLTVGETPQRKRNRDAVAILVMH